MDLQLGFTSIVNPKSWNQREPDQLRPVSVDPIFGFWSAKVILWLTKQSFVAPQFGCTEYGDAAHQEKLSRKDFQANPLNGIVVHEWIGKKYRPGKLPQIVTLFRTIG